MITGLNSRLQPENSLAARDSYVPGVEFEAHYEVQARLLRTSRVALGTVVNTAMGETGTANFALGSVLSLSSEITFDIPFQAKKVFGNAYISLYQGTILNDASQIYPVRGGSVTEGKYRVQGWYDAHSWNGTTNIWKGNITDTAGTSAQVISFVADWVYLDYTVGTIT
jgi:hypothetical protein